MQPKSNTILKVISNEASDEERIAIEKWANKSVENSNTLKGHKKLWNILDYECDHCPDLQKAWNKINTSLSPLPIKTRSFDLVYYAQRIAAILFLVGALAFVYFAATNYQPNAGTNWKAITAGANPETPIILPDNSKVWLRKGSTLKYSEDFANRREVQLSGVAFFEVTPNKNIPFRVETNQIGVIVTGTKFLITEKLAETEVFVKEGSVAVSSISTKNNTLNLTSGKGLRFDQNTLRFYELEAFDQNSISWFTGNLTFNAEPLSKVIDQLESLYGVKFNVKSAELLNCRISASFDQKSLPEIIDILDNILNIRFKNIDTKNISISGKGC